MRRSAVWAQWLNDNVADLSYDDAGTTGNVFVEWLPEKPDFAVMVGEGAGGRPELTKTANDLPDLQFLIRGEPTYPNWSYDAAPYEIYDKLNCLDGVTIGDDAETQFFLIGCTASQAGPVPIGRDEANRPLWSLNFNLRVKANTTNRP